MRTLNPSQFQALIASGAQLLDVRLPEEVAIAGLAGALNIPLHELPQRLDEIDAARPLAVFCHHGVRSEHASRYLEAQGCAEVAHLEGGIDAWSQEIDTRLPRY
jgi:rhodanese-related sulfurtransferase